MHNYFTKLVWIQFQSPAWDQPVWRLFVIRLVVTSKHAVTRLLTRRSTETFSSNADRLQIMNQIYGTQFFSLHYSENCWCMFKHLSVPRWFVFNLVACKWMYEVTVSESLIYDPWSQSHKLTLTWSFLNSWFMMHNSFSHGRNHHEWYTIYALLKWSVIYTLIIKCYQIYNIV